jgi:ribosomal protein L11 methyltransferase
MTENKYPQEWEQFQVEVNLDLAEDLAAQLGEILPGGVVLEKNYGDLFPHELAQYHGPARLYGYYPAEISQEIQERITRILGNIGHEDLLLVAEYSSLENRNWATAWQERYQPVPVGKGIVVVPTWLDNPYLERIPIWMDPGMAFGSGTHLTTQLSLALLEKALIESNSPDMIDIGCGSGILSICGAKLGVSKVMGLDIDPDSIRISKENAEINAVSASVSFREGSVKELIGKDGSQHSASLVVANIIAPILEELFEDGLGYLVSPGGLLILSGILKEQLPGIQSYLDKAGFILSELEHKEDWIGLIAEKPPNS